MKKLNLLALILPFVFIINCNPQNFDNIFDVDGLTDKVEIVVDKWGIAHIYAQNEHDLFFAQGFNAARDRLFQLEIWRRQTNGTVAEILGESEVKRDIGTRLFKFRGDMDIEMNHYHPRGKMIIESFADGVNAYIKQTNDHPEILPPEFAILGIKPGLWTPGVVISRHQGLLGNINQELTIGRAVAAMGEDKVHALSSFTPDNPDLSLHASITPEMLEKDILGIYNAFRRKVTFQNDDRSIASNTVTESFFNDPESIGSNNWIIDGSLSQSGSPMMANDPHRTQAIPSLRYWVHLSAPGWDVIGGGEPEIPGVSIGHNGYGAWGLTVFATDAEDLYAYDINPDNPGQYMYNGAWEDMTTVAENIAVKGGTDTTVFLQYTRHGPVTFVDTVLHKAWAVRCGWLEPGGSPYLASLRMDQAKSWEEFREACSYSHIPGENMIWADKDGTIGWQAVGIAPVRKNWSGLVPVPGDGSYEWAGYLPIMEKPHLSNPENGFFGTANQYVVPDGYDHMDAIGYLWSDPSRGNRINAVLDSKESFTMEDMQSLQTDYYSSPASMLVPMLSNRSFADPLEEKCRLMLVEWDFQLSPGSVEAGIYIVFEQNLIKEIRNRAIPEDARKYIRSIPMQKTIALVKSILTSEGDQLLKSSFASAVESLKDKYGDDVSKWKYGQENFKHIQLKHPLNPLLTGDEKSIFNTSILPRGGNSYTLNNTSGNNNQTHGASFRIIVDTGDFDKTVGCNSPGQSGNPGSTHYKDLFELWAKDGYFPVYYSRDKILENKDEVILLR